MPFSDLDYTKEKLREQLILAEQHLADGSWRECGCVEDKHRLALRGYALEGKLMAPNEGIFAEIEAFSAELGSIGGEKEARELAARLRSFRKKLESCSSGKCAVGNAYKPDSGSLSPVKGKMPYRDLGIDVAGDFVGKIVDAITIEYDRRYRAAQPLHLRARTYFPLVGLVASLVGARYMRGDWGDIVQKAGSFLLVNTGVDVVQTVVLPPTAGLVRMSAPVHSAQAYTNVPRTFTR